MQRKEVGNPVKLLDRSHFLHAVGLEDRPVGDERIVGDDIHAQRLALAAHQSADVAVGVDAEGFALEFRTRTRREAVARHEDHHGQRQFGHGIGVLTRGVHHHDAPRRSRRKVHVVVTRAGADHDLQVFRRGDDLGGHLVAADDQRVDVGHGFEQLALVGVFFEQRQFVSGVLDDLTDSVHGFFGEGFFRCNQYLHSFDQ